MYTKRQKVNIDDTRFIFTTNFSGDPAVTALALTSAVSMW